MSEVVGDSTHKAEPGDSALPRGGGLPFSGSFSPSSFPPSLSSQQKNLNINQAKRRKITIFRQFFSTNLIIVIISRASLSSQCKKREKINKLNSGVREKEPRQKVKSDDEEHDGGGNADEELLAKIVIMVLLMRTKIKMT